MKINVFFRVFLSPALFAATTLWPPSDRLTIRLFLLIAILVALVVRAFFSKRKYLDHLLVNDDTVTIQFITPRLKREQLILNRQEITDLQLSPDGFRYSAYGVLKLTAAGKQHMLVIISNKVFRQAKQQMDCSQTIAAS